MGVWQRYYPVYNYKIGVAGALYKSMEFGGPGLKNCRWMTDLQLPIWQLKLVQKWDIVVDNTTLNYI